MQIIGEKKSGVASTYWCLEGNGWEWGNGIFIDSYCGSFPHSLLSTSKSSTRFLLAWSFAANAFLGVSLRGVETTDGLTDRK